jgi:cytoskeletal protein CcmA (bactofilin family)
MFGRQERKRTTEIDTLIGRNTRVEGDIEFAGGCHIDGYVKGRVQAQEDAEAVLSISDTGTVEGSVEVPQVILNGTVNGDVTASGRIELGASARVVGNVFYSLIEMAIGAEVNGQLIHTPAASPSPALVTHQNSSDNRATGGAAPAPMGGPAVDQATGTGS